MKKAYPRANNSFKPKGIATIEFAILLPLMLFLWVVTIEAGMAFFKYNTLTKAVRDGARYVSLNIMEGSKGKFYESCITNFDASPCADAKTLIQFNTNDATDTSKALFSAANTINVVVNRAPAGSNTNFSLTATYIHCLIVGDLINSSLFLFNTPSGANFGTSSDQCAGPGITLTSTVVMRGQ